MSLNKRASVMRMGQPSHATLNFEPGNHPLCRLRLGAITHILLGEFC